LYATYKTNTNNPH